MNSVAFRALEKRHLQALALGEVFFGAEAHRQSRGRARPSKSQSGAMRELTELLAVRVRAGRMRTARRLVDPGSRAEREAKAAPQAAWGAGGFSIPDRTTLMGTRSAAPGQ